MKTLLLCQSRIGIISSSLKPVKKVFKNVLTLKKDITVFTASK